MADSTFKIAKTGDMCIRRIERDDACVALILRYSNGRWGVFDTHGNAQVVPGSFENPKEALTAYAESNATSEVEG